MGAFASDDEGSIFLFLGELQVSEHVAQFLLPASHSERTHPVAGLPETHSERESEINGSDSLKLFRILNLSDFHLQADTPDNILPRSGDHYGCIHVRGVRSACAASLRFAPCPGKWSAEGVPSPGTGFEIVNVDITIALQEPKLRPHIDAMRESLAQVMGIDKNRVSVKATTTERLGFVGRGEGCEVWATVLLAAKNEK